MVIVGILGLQGAIEPHEEILNGLKVNHRRVTEPSHLKGLAAIILPGGESTTMLRLLHTRHLFQPLKEFCNNNPTWGVCAGAILLARKVLSPVQESLEIINIVAERNAYGSQLDSFSAVVEPLLPSARNDINHDLLKSMSVDFIRAPKLSSGSSIDNPKRDVHCIYTYQNEPVGFIEGKCIVTSFHTELRGISHLHELLLSL
jgi:5'-phosphate synthase pdxT subunit